MTPAGTVRRSDRMTTVRVDLRKDLLDDLMRDANGASLTTRLNSALAVGLEHKKAITADVNHLQNAKDVGTNGNIERA